MANHCEQCALSGVRLYPSKKIYSFVAKRHFRICAACILREEGECPFHKRQYRYSTLFPYQYYCRFCRATEEHLKKLHKDNYEELEFFARSTQLDRVYHRVAAAVCTAAFRNNVSERRMIDAIFAAEKNGNDVLLPLKSPDWLQEKK